MTAWGLISDVHGNLPALQAAVAACRSRGATRFAFLGDLLGRGDSEGCVSLIRTLADVSVVGNRDLDWRDRVDERTRDYVLALPTAQRADDFLAVHGDARLDRDLCSADIRRGFGRAYGRLIRDGARVGIFGHTHHARVWRLDGPDAPPTLLHDGAADRTRAVISVPPDDEAVRYVVNVGTTGLPFPGKGPPSCAVYDIEARTVEIIPLQPRR
jgi:predicted phosphodiesterase